MDLLGAVIHALPVLAGMQRDRWERGDSAGAAGALGVVGALGFLGLALGLGASLFLKGPWALVLGVSGGMGGVAAVFLVATLVLTPPGGGERRVGLGSGALLASGTLAAAWFSLPGVAPAPVALVLLSSSVALAGLGAWQVVLGQGRRVPDSERPSPALLRPLLAGAAPEVAWLTRADWRVLHRRASSPDAAVAGFSAAVACRDPHRPLRDGLTLALEGTGACPPEGAGEFRRWLVEVFRDRRSAATAHEVLAEVVRRDTLHLQPSAALALARLESLPADLGVHLLARGLEAGLDPDGPDPAPEQEPGDPALREGLRQALAIPTPEAGRAAASLLKWGEPDRIGTLAAAACVLAPARDEAEALEKVREGRRLLGSPVRRPALLRELGRVPELSTHAWELLWDPRIPQALWERRRLDLERGLARRQPGLPRLLESPAHRPAVLDWLERGHGPKVLANLVLLLFRRRPWPEVFQDLLDAGPDAPLADATLAVLLEDPVSGPVIQDAFARNATASPGPGHPGIASASEDSRAQWEDRAPTYPRR